jgi:restriction system protein
MDAIAFMVVLALLLSWLLGWHLFVPILLCLAFLCIFFVIYMIWGVFSGNKFEHDQYASNRRNEERLHKENIERWLETALEHKAALSLRYRQLVSIDSYGKPDLRSWKKELVLFRRSANLVVDDIHLSKFEKIITDRVRSWVVVGSLTTVSQPFNSIDPFEYERWCAQSLREHGWDASTTKGGGDQGVDIIAKKDNRKVALQCKLYTSGAVGNKAVQEIHAAAAFIEADRAVVVSNADYTLSARQLAAKLGVLLVHHSHLPELGILLPS